MRILIGSNNQHKVGEISAILRTIFSEELEVLLPRDLPSFPTEIEECGDTLEANAMIKALEMYEATARPCIADDTGLEVAALNGRPGVFSARFAGENATDADNRKLLLQELRGAEQREAQFRTVICFYDGFRPIFAEGVCRGRILNEERGDGGFGYDPVFMPEGESRSFAEMPAAEKNAISHRGRALQQMAHKLETLRAERMPTGDLALAMEEISRPQR